MLVDEIKIKVTAGKGGDGVVAFSRNKMELGPTGGRGGDGGNIHLEGVSDLGALNQLKHTKVFKAGDGKSGSRKRGPGEEGQDLVIKVPVGTIIHNRAAKTEKEIIKIGQRITVARGGWGGHGNFHFRSSTNTSPKEFELGQKGQSFQLELELKLIADVGLVGLPNAGKSSLINELTRAQSKVANYPFTTLEPNLGAYYDLILADIPGLIEGASGGKGLGIKFLKHVERTKVLFHLVSAESEDPDRDYKIIRKELGAYNETLLEKDEYLFLSKTDLIPAGDVSKKLAKLKKLNPSVLLLSIHDWESIERVKKILNGFIKEKTA